MNLHQEQVAALVTVVDNSGAWLWSHLLQTFITTRFSYHDRGEIENMKLYGVKTAPDVPLQKITNKVCIIHGTEDFAGNPKAIQLLKTKMKSKFL